MAELEDEQDLYKVLGVSRDASQADIRKAYHRLALELHPDRNKGSEEATQKFQSLQQIYGILSDEDKRKRYDQTGSLEEADELSSQSFDELYTFYRDLYKKVSTEDIDSFSAGYRGSDDETLDLIKNYHRFEGNMSQVFQWQMCSDPARDSHRFCAAIRAHCTEHSTKPTAAFTKWAKGVDKKPAPKDPLRPLTSPAQTGSEQALFAAIRGRQQARGDEALAALEAKYCKSPASKRKRGGKAQASSNDDEQNMQPVPSKGGKGRKAAAKSN